MNYKNTRFHESIKIGDIEEAKLLIDQGVDLEYRYTFGETPVQLAIMFGRCDLAVFLINKGVELETKNTIGFTSLHLSILNDRPEIAILIINKGVNLETEDNDGNTALHLSILEDLPEVLSLLINKGVDLEKKNNDGYTALHLAVKYDRTEIANLLIYNGANLETKYNDKNALEYATLNNRLDIVRRIEVIKIIYNQIYLFLKLITVPSTFNAMDNSLIKYIAEEQGINEIWNSEMSIFELKESYLMKSFIERYIFDLINLYEMNKEIFDKTECADALFVDNTTTLNPLSFPDYSLYFHIANSKNELIQLIKQQRSLFVVDHREDIIKRQHPYNLYKLGKFRV